ncbi:MAG: hypothetical protein JWL75_121 [Parcubacteria group bacterium]|nr:hypothetical protein [Parcubacteria group bacterium]
MKWYVIWFIALWPVFYFGMPAVLVYEGAISSAKAMSMRFEPYAIGLPAIIAFVASTLIVDIYRELRK